MTPGEKMIWASVYGDGGGFPDPMRRAQYATEVVRQARFALDMFMKSVQPGQEPEHVLALQEMLGE